MASAPSADVELSALSGDARPLANWLTTFPLVLVVVDPYTLQSSWILNTARRFLANYRAADCRTAWLCTSGAADAERFLGPLAKEFLTFADPDRLAVKSLGLETLPAVVVIRQDGSLLSWAEGWEPEAWRIVAEELSAQTSWSRPQVPAPGDPVAFPGTPALG